MLTLFKYDNQVILSKQLASLLLMLCAFLVLLGAHLLRVPFLDSLAFLAAFFASTVALGICVVSLIYHFYSTMSGNQSYLTYTIPYKTPAIIFSKLIVSILWFIACVGTIFLVWWGYCSMKEIEILSLVPELRVVLSFIVLPVSGQLLLTICLLALCVSFSVLPPFRNNGMGILVAIIAYPVLNTLSGLVLVISMVIASFVNGTMDVVFSNTSDIAALEAIDSMKLVVFGLYVVLAAVCLFAAIRIFDRHRAI